VTSTAASPRPALSAAPPGPWWRDAVTYQVYIRSFADGDGDGMGDIAGIRSRLGYLAELGVDAVWINPWYPSPQADAGYDVADYRDIEPVFGTLADAEALIEQAHGLGLRVLLDIVPNHTSDEHPWFVEALASGPGSPARKRYLFRPGQGPDGARPPNDWKAVFGGPAWHRVTEPDGRPGEWYLHLFDPKQPDLNWDDPVVRTEFLDILRFWFDRGADGFRIDVAHGLVKDPALPDLGRHDPRGRNEPQLLGAATRSDHPHWDRPGVHEIYRTWRQLAEGYDPPKVFVAEAWVSSPARLAAYLRPGELNTAFDFDFVIAPWNAASLRRTATSSLLAHDSVGAPVMWVLSNHDITRHVTRFGRPDARAAKDPLHSDHHGEADPILGRRRARAALLLELALPGGVYLYQGEELGLEEVEDLPEEVLQDPTWARSHHTQRGRDGCRVPLPWTASGPSLGFGAAPGWLPQPASWGGPGGLSVEAQGEDPGSMLTFYRTALKLRRELAAQGALGAGDAASLTWLDLGEDVVAFRREPGVVCVLNAGAGAAPLPAGRVLLASGPVEEGQLPPDTSVWLSTTWPAPSAPAPS
jgi:alpha-glucosidase